MNEEVAAEIQKLDPSSVIELYELDCTHLGGDVFRFHNGTNKLSQNIFWQGLEYIRFPMQVTGFETSGQGQFPRPTIVVSNVMSAITTVLTQYGDLLKSKFTRRRTFLKYLDVINFPGGVNPTVDPTVFFPDELFYIDRKANEDRDQVAFELSSAADLQGVQLPQRVVIQSVCPWIYRGVECGYTGVALFDESGNVLPMPASPEAIAMRDAWQDIQDAKVACAAAQETLNQTAYTLTEASKYSPETRYTVVPNNYVVTDSYGNTLAYWDNAVVTLGTTYAKGNFKDQQYALGTTFTIYEIIGYTRNEVAYDAALAAYDAAIVARDDAQDVLDTALVDFDTAMAAIPPDDPVFKQDRCGKHISSCRMRFDTIEPNSPLPFGGFPGVSR